MPPNEVCKYPSKIKTELNTSFPGKGGWWDGRVLTWKSSMFVSTAKLCIGDTQP